MDLRAFQSRSTDWEGKPLKPDGLLGPRTNWALALASLPAWRRAVVARACGEAGVRETGGPNAGARVERYLEFAGGRRGQPWCAAFLSWVLAGHATPGLGALRFVRELGRTDVVLPGDCWCYPVGSAGNGHCGLVIGIGSDRVMTCEGNGSDAVRIWIRPLEGLEVRSAHPVLVPRTGSGVGEAGSGTR